MPGSPPTSTYFAIPRYADTDAADFAADVNPIVDGFDTALGVRRQDLTVKSSTYTASPGDCVVATAAITVTLPSAPPAQSSVTVLANGGAVTVNRSGSDTITNGSSTGQTTLTVSQYALVRFCYLGGVWYVVGPQDTGWVALSLAPNVSSTPGGYTASARLVGSRVWLKGGLTSSSSFAGGTLATVPVGLRPTATVLLPITGGYTVSTAGVIGPGSAGVFNLPLDGLNYSLS